jgi:hypothetical protein
VELRLFGQRLLVRVVEGTTVVRSLFAVGVAVSRFDTREPPPALAFRPGPAAAKLF